MYMYMLFTSCRVHGIHQYMYNIIHVYRVIIVYNVFCINVHVHVHVRVHTHAHTHTHTHTGKEVAEYCSRRIPEMLKSNLSYKSGDLPTALKTLFMHCDRKLLEKDVIREMKQYMEGAGEDDEAESDSRSVASSDRI